VESLIGILAQVDEQRPAWGLMPGRGQVAPHLRKNDLPRTDPNGVQIAIGAKVEELFTLARALSGQQVHLVVAIKMRLEGLAVGFDAG